MFPQQTHADVTVLGCGKREREMSDSHTLQVRPSVNSGNKVCTMQLGVLESGSGKSPKKGYTRGENMLLVSPTLSEEVSSQAAGR